MSQGDSFGGDEYPTEQYPPSPVAEGHNGPAKENGRSTLNVPTILASAGVAAVISALVVAIGLVGLIISNNHSSNDSAAATPTVVNLGAAQSPVPGAAVPAATQPGAQPAAGAPTVPPAENVPSSGGGAGPAATTAPGAAPAPGGAAAQPQVPATSQAAALPQALSAGQLNTKVNLIMNTNASRSSRAAELEGGTRALPGIDAVAQMIRVSGAGFSYQVVDPVTQSGTTLSARLQMSLVGNGSRYLNFSWVWMDNKWKLSNQSVCAVASYAMLPCPVS